MHDAAMIGFSGIEKASIDQHQTICLFVVRNACPGRASQLKIREDTENLRIKMLDKHIYVPNEIVAGSSTEPYMRSSIPMFSDFVNENYLQFCASIGHKHIVHRKIWEFAWIFDRLQKADAIAPNRRGLCFGSGKEQLPSLFAKMGCYITATDAPDNDDNEGWSTTGQHASSLNDLFHPQIVAEDVFRKRVSFVPCDMNAISETLRDYDFCWSACCLEHLGSLQHGLNFIVNSLDTLKPGGIACHTTEFNLSSNEVTLETPGLSLFRRSDIEAVVDRMSKLGHKVWPVVFEIGQSFMDHYIDTPPYSSPHLKIEAASYTTTSIGIVVQRR